VNGIAAAPDWIAGLVSFEIYDLQEGTGYYFNVLVKDENNNFLGL